MINRNMVAALGLICMGIPVKSQSSKVSPKFKKQYRRQFGGMNKHLPVEERVHHLLNYSENAYRTQGTVDDIVGSFAMAQDLIHSKEFKHNYQQHPRKLEVVEQFTQLGNQLSR